MFTTTRNYSFSPLIKKTPPKISTERTRPTNIKNYKKYNNLNSNSILLQLIKPTSQLPTNLNEYLQFSAIDDFQDYLSQQIHRYIIFNHYRYTGETQKSFYPDISSYILSTGQLLDTKFKKSVLIMLNQHLQFLITTIKELSKHFNDDSTQNSSFVQQGNQPKYTISEKTKYTPPQSQQNSIHKPHHFTPQTHHQTPQPSQQYLVPPQLSIMEQRILEKEQKQMEQYLKEQQKNQIQGQQSQVINEAQYETKGYLGDLFQQIISKSDQMGTDKKYSESDTNYQSQPKYQLDEWT